MWWSVRSGGAETTRQHVRTDHTTTDKAQRNGGQMITSPRDPFSQSDHAAMQMRRTCHNARFPIRKGRDAYFSL